MPTTGAGNGAKPAESKASKWDDKVAVHHSDGSVTIHDDEDAAHEAWTVTAVYAIPVKVPHVEPEGGDE